MKKNIERQRLPDIVFQPAITPIEAAMLPARAQRRGYGALRHARESWQPGRGRVPAFAIRQPRLRGWGPAGR